MCLPDATMTCAILYNILRKQMEEDLETLDIMVDNGRLEDGDDDVYSDAKVCGIEDYGMPQRSI